MKKIIRWVLGSVVLILALVVALLAWCGGPVVRKSVNTFGPMALGVPVTLRDAQFSPLKGHLRLSGLHVGNPKGFHTAALMDIEDLDIEVDVRSLFSNPIVIRRITVREPRITYEQGLKRSNVEALLEQIGGEAGEKANPEPAGTAAKQPKTAGKKVVIDELTIMDGKVSLSVTAAMGLSAPIALATIRLTNVGREGGTGGIGLVDVTRILLVSILKSVTQAIGGVGGLAVDGLKAMGGGAAKIGTGAIDALKSVGGGKVAEGAKEMGQGATQVGGALVEGVKKMGTALSGLTGGNETNAPAAEK